jgi:hypothetical protein
MAATPLHALSPGAVAGVRWPSALKNSGSPERTYAVDRDAAIRSIDAAVAAEARRYVMVSYFGAGPDQGRAAKRHRPQYNWAEQDTQQVQ